MIQMSIEHKPAKLTARDEVIADNCALRSWLLDHAQPTTYLLAHADDGVIWGRVDAAEYERETQKKLMVGRDALPPEEQSTDAELKLMTLQSLRLFSEVQEVLLWRVESGWRSRTIADVDADPTWMKSFDESQFLWGTRGEQFVEHGFTRLSHGREGLRHVVPVLANPTEEKPLRLCVRHYVNCDKLARVVASRLVRFITE